MVRENFIGNGVYWSFLGVFTSSLIGLAQLIIFARFLSPGDFGDFAILSILLMICNVLCHTCFSDILISAKDLSKSQYSTLYYLNVLLGVILFALFCKFSNLFMYFSDNNDISHMVIATSFNLILISLSTQFISILKKELNFKEIFFVTLFANSFSLLSSIFFIFQGCGVWSMVLSTNILHLLSSLSYISIFALRRSFPSLYISIKCVRTLLKSILYRAYASILNIITYKSDQILIGFFFNNHLLGIYNFSSNIANIPLSKINPIVTQVYFPVFSKLRLSNNLLISQYRKSIRLISFLNSPIYLGLFFFTDNLINVIFGSKWIEAATILKIHCIYSLIRSLSNINISLVLSKQKYKWPFYLNLLIFILLPFCFLINVIYFDIFILSITLCLAQFFISLLVFKYFVKNLISLHTKDYLKDLILPIFCSVLMFSPLVLLDRVNLFTNSVVELFTIVIISIPLYLFISYKLQFQHFSEFIFLFNRKVTS